MIDSFTSVARFCFFLTLFCILTDFGVSTETRYDRKYDYFDIDTLVENPRLLKKYMDCFLGRGPCTPIGRVFKVALPEVVTTRCKKCTPAQRSFAKRTFGAFKKDLPEHYIELKKLLDPENKYFDAFEKAIADA